ncbi:hypothetical protein CRV02_00215 [Arcobacter sp. CECT 8989]|uniref:hypothetical protein n=1 Tax=Arcobacter sp. CECT 8989 TaxID=2044509 RepID=UPI00100C12E9|nr:hypothetical protein [Arcobacter sp. CECT 8989]RXK03655.1 hypothetical protein CRV02_00215 [Arcobacter sp. CECT 8989]
MTRTIFEFVRYLTYFIWCIIGLIFWLPFLIRMIAFFVGSILVSVSGKADMTVAQEGLDRAVRFYPDGFVHIRESINNLINEKVIENKNYDSKIDFWMPLLEHFIFAFMFWGLSLLMFVKILQVN